MKHMTWAIVVIGLLVAGCALPAEAAGGRGGGVHRGGSGSHVGSPRMGSRSHAGSPRMGRRSHAGSPRVGSGWHTEVLGGVVRGTGKPSVGRRLPQRRRWVAWGHAGLHWGWPGVVGARLVGRALPLLCRAARGVKAGTHGVHPAGAAPRSRPTGTTAQTRGRTTRTSRNAPAGGCRWCQRQPPRTASRRTPRGEPNRAGNGDLRDRRSRGCPDRTFPRTSGPHPPGRRHESLALPRLNTLTYSPARSTSHVPHIDHPDASV
jgi:hypothetical protein